VKTYVDGQIAATNELSEVLAAGNVTGANDIDVENAQKVQFRDADIYLNSSVDGQLDIVADGEVQIDTALVDINGNLDVSGTTNISGSTTFTKNAIAGVAISTIARASNTVTVTNSAVHGLTNGDLVNINGVADTSFNGYFTVAVSSTTVFTYNQTGADGSSTGGTSTEVVYNLNASGTALNWMNGPLNIAANSGIDGLEITQSGSGEALSITGGNAIFGDNDKAVFGAGSDLQIFHDASDSIINDNGTGSLKLQQGGSTKLEVTATGIDVTGTVTADGLTVDGETDGTAVALLRADNNSVTKKNTLRFEDTDTTTQNDQQIGRIEFYSNDTDHTGVDAVIEAVSATTGLKELRFLTSDTANTPLSRLAINKVGNISFYDDTGVSQSFFWDSSAESLGIGTSSPDTLLHLSDTAGGAVIRLERNDTSIVSTDVYGEIQFEGQDSSAGSAAGIRGKILGVAEGATGEMALAFQTAGGYGASTERMRIDSSGNVSIGDSDNNGRKLRIYGTGDLLELTSTNSGVGGAQLDLTHNSPSPADGDNVGIINFSGRDTGLNGFQAANITGKIGSVSTESGELHFGTRTDASTYDGSKMILDASGNLLVGLTTGQDALIHAQAPKTTYTDYATVFAGGTDSNNGEHAISLMTAGNSLAGIIGSNLSIDGSSFSQPAVSRSSAYISLTNTTVAGKTSTITFGGLTKGTTTALPKMTLDGDGNLLVGKTSVDSGVVGVEAKAIGTLVATVAGDTVSLLNRKTNDGEILRFQKDGTTVGSIGSRGGVVSHIILDPRSGGAGLTAAGASLFPTNNVGTVSDAAIDLGYSVSGTNYRFKDLYLSGAVIIDADGATGNAWTHFKNDDRTWLVGCRGTDGDSFTIYDLTADVPRVKVDASGNLLVGTTSASPSNTDSFLYNVSGKAAVLNHASGTSSGQQFLGLAYNGGYIGSIAQSGTTAVLYNTSSDQRLKENIVDAPSASDDIDAIQVRSFDWKVDGSHQKYGMVAQELQTVAPEAVSAPEDPEEMMGVDYSKLVPMMLKEIQSLRARVAQLES